MIILINASNKVKRIPGDWQELPTDDRSRSMFVAEVIRPPAARPLIINHSTKGALPFQKRANRVYCQKSD